MDSKAVEAAAELVAKRLKDEFGYRSVKPLPIFEREGGTRVMYYMIHATDHPEAPRLMARAYRRAVMPKESVQQLALELGVESVEPPGEEPDSGERTV